MSLLRTVRLLLRIIALVALLGFLAWAGLAIGIDGSAPLWFALCLLATLLACSLTALVTVRPWHLALTLAYIPPTLVLVWWLSIAASNERDWYADVARLPTATVEGHILTVRNVRHFAYRSDGDFTKRWETRR